MLRVEKVNIDAIYVPTARRKTLHPETVRHLAEDILENGMKTPIQVRLDGKRYVLVEGCTGWKRRNGWAKPPSTPIWCRQGGIDAAAGSERTEEDKMAGVEQVTVEAGEAGMRLDRWFKAHYPGLGFGHLQKLLRSGQVRLDGGRAKTDTRVEPGQVVRIPPLEVDKKAARKT